MALLKSTLVQGDLKVLGDAKFGGQADTNVVSYVDVILSNEEASLGPTSPTPRLVFLRGETGDGYYDWSMQAQSSNSVFNISTRGMTGVWEDAVNIGPTAGGVAMSVVGKVNATVGFFQTSDINKKDIVGDIDLQRAYELVDKCQEIMYILKDDSSKKQQIGMVAQEVQQFFPEIVSETNDGSLTIDYSKLTVIVLRVMKDLIRRISELENKCS